MRIYRDIIKSAWHILWHYAWLWPFGLFAAFLGNGGEYGSVVSAVDKVSQQGDLLAGIRQAILNHRLIDFFQGIKQAIDSAPAQIITTLFLMLVVVLGVIWIIIVSQAALIKASSNINENTPVTFNNAAIEGNQHFWPILLLNILSRFVIWLLLAVTILPFLISYLARGGGAEFDSYIIISFLIFVPLAVIISFIIKYAVIAVVLEKQSWWPALVKAINLFFRNWLVSLEMAAILFVINYILSIVVYSLIANSLLSAPLVFALRGINLATVLKFLPQILLLMAVGAWFGTFQYAAWTILYRRLVSGQIMPKLIRLSDDIPNYLENWFRRNPASLPKPKKSSTK
ncbi:MAG: hypothetical protein A2588_02735 [Candidatus Veblenbacteria bacterium RIFOXYD1_FULL_43_11]|uniref:Glycerophosphoryl diester phosphodiesterase membrane domain-containing protein n=1 Tax=Candidatus Veblenbacteria bacterium RIFOXYD1_FULL_43_11 TaxID=1802429 RepID=A0A1G2Q704_9BACT|nr:MAG: hypothetical protein A2588_02735 [Candidatus Veblenbacteria bacterium RIFOXYD1_FULL_43_11]